MSMLIFRMTGCQSVLIMEINGCWNEFDRIKRSKCTPVTTHLSVLGIFIGGTLASEMKMHVNSSQVKTTVDV